VGSAIIGTLGLPKDAVQFKGSVRPLCLFSFSDGRPTPTALAARLAESLRAQRAEA
jgi:hypothetical protein